MRRSSHESKERGETGKVQGGAAQGRYSLRGMERQPEGAKNTRKKQIPTDANCPLTPSRPLQKQTSGEDGASRKEQRVCRRLRCPHFTNSEEAKKDLGIKPACGTKGMGGGQNER